MFDFDVVTGPTQPPHCPLADEFIGESGSESVPQPSIPTAKAAAAPAETHTTKGEKVRS
ncbi:hypothetical protein [Azospirillum sp. TSH100]|uniref:hypothetical protein n=1 Tax=Azospirillum sp. TSH100 TaxID=652764 RepID=UPI001304EB46|nr:hypothetical protein [Azospirillum sp. TSH100]